MSLYIDTTGLAKAAIAICCRCQRKFPIGELMADRNAGPGMRVCREDNDRLDPWRLPARRTENITLQYPRPDVALTGSDESIFTGDLLGYTFIQGHSALGA